VARVSDLILVERRGTLALITLNRPDARNPLDRDTAVALRDACGDLFATSDVRSVAITGSGSAFCAGGDLRQMQQMASGPIEAAYEWPGAIVDLHKMMLSAPKPVIAAVNGPAYAGGMGLAGMCDIVYAVRTATFAMPEVRMGLFPMIIVAHLARSLPRKVLLELMLTGQPLDAVAAQQVGFVSKVFDTTEALHDGLDALATTLAQVSPQAVRLGRRAFTILADLPASQALDAAQFLNLPFFFGADLQEGTSAFFDKRRPAWVPGDDDDAPEPEAGPRA
jgi:enoyl-CoA hydratase/carnithine racemase